MTSRDIFGVGFELQGARQTIDEGLDMFNGEMQAAWDIFEAVVNEAWDQHVAGAIQDMLDITTGADEFRCEIVGDMESYRDDKSDRWQESDAGEQYAEWMEQWEHINLEATEPEMPYLDCPEPVDPPDFEDELFANLPDVP